MKRPRCPPPTRRVSTRSGSVPTPPSAKTCSGGVMVLRACEERHGQSIAASLTGRPSISIASGRARSRGTGARPPRGIAPDRLGRVVEERRATWVAARTESWSEIDVTMPWGRALARATLRPRAAGHRGSRIGGENHSDARRPAHEPRAEPGDPARQLLLARAELPVHEGGPPAGRSPGTGAARSVHGAVVAREAVPGRGARRPPARSSRRAPPRHACHDPSRRRRRRARAQAADAARARRRAARPWRSAPCSAMSTSTRCWCSRGAARRAAHAVRPPGSSRRALPRHDAAALAYACRCRLALVQVPPRGIETSQVTVRPRRGSGDRSPGALARRSPPSIPRRLRACDRRGRHFLVAPHGSPRRRRATATAAADVPRRAWSRAPRPSRRAEARPGRARATALPPSTTTSCSRTPTADGSSPTSVGRSSVGSVGAATARSSTTVPPAGLAPTVTETPTALCFRFAWRLDFRSVRRRRSRRKASASCGSPPPTSIVTTSW